MIDTVLTPQDWQIRHYIYQTFVEATQPPTVERSAKHFVASANEIRQAYQRLHNHHHIFLEPNTTQIRMANPFSAVETRYQVQVEDRMYWANCVWDSLGIAAALKLDADIMAHDLLTDDIITYAVRDRVLEAPDNLLTHFALPVRRWYDDLIQT